MSLTVSNDRKRKLTKEEESLLNLLERLPLKKQERLLELSRLFKDACDDAEKCEIRETMAEVIFRARPLTASPVDDDVTKVEIDKLSNHRRYVAKQIKKLRVKSGMTQGQLAKKAKLPQPHIARLESGYHAPTYKTIERIAGALGVEPGIIDPAYD
ncbi:MAG TPA: helix-turn-helix transcriptional regulator [Pirellulales bacterium]|nr:helix-turn-helix transcriptional regulator [Pirellulales bacterium]